MTHKHPSNCQTIRTVSMIAFKESQQQCYDMVDASCVVKLKCVKFDKLAATTPKAVLISVGERSAWVPRSTIESIGTEDSKSMYMWIPNWLELQWS